MDKRKGAPAAAQELDFFQAAVLKHYVKGPKANTAISVIMVEHLHAEWGDS